jgi:NADH dehydrogenase FAD-containing subunit
VVAPVVWNWATSLGHKLGRKHKAEITLVDRNHSHLWKPLLHEVATGSLDDGVDALSYLAHARNHSFSFQLGSLTNINRETKRCTWRKSATSRVANWCLSASCLTIFW